MWCANGIPASKCDCQSGQCSRRNFLCVSSPAQTPINTGWAKHKVFLRFDSNAWHSVWISTDHNLTSHCCVAAEHCYQRVLSQIACCLKHQIDQSNKFARKPRGYASPKIRLTDWLIGVGVNAQILSHTCRLWVMKRTPSLFIGVCGVLVNSRLFSHTWADNFLKIPWKIKPQRRM